MYCSYMYVQIDLYTHSIIILKVSVFLNANVYTNIAGNFHLVPFWSYFCDTKFVLAINYYLVFR